MGELINGRTPAQIKAGLRCGKGDVQPKCADCAYLGYYDEDFEVQHFDCGEIDNDALAYIERLEVALKCEQVARDVLLEEMPKWISIKIKLPPRELKVLAVDGHGCIRMLAFWKKEKEHWTWIENLRFTHRNDITHWMPLPEPPEEGA